jgi:RND family efflux transporter MFP subunit
MCKKIKSEVVRYKRDQQALEHDKQLLALAIKSLDRQKHLTQKMVASESQLDAAKEEVARRQLEVTNRTHELEDHSNRLAVLEAELLRSEAVRDQAKIDVERASIKAPFEGKITTVDVAVGDRVREGDSIVKLFDINDVEIRAQIPGQYVEMISKSVANGKKISADTAIDGEKYKLHLTRISGQVETGKVSVDGFFGLKEKGDKLPLGQTVAIKLTLPEQQNVFVVPIEALYHGDHVYKLQDERIYNVLVERRGQIKNQQGKTQILIASDKLNTGDLVVTNQLPNVVSGLKVYIIKE